MTEAAARIRILVLDDEESMRVLASHLLRGDGYEVDVAASAFEARAVVDKRPPDLLLCDLALDGLQGREAANMLQARRPGLKVLYMSGNDEADFRKEIEHGPAAFLAKPFERDALLAAVKRALED